MPFRSEKFFLGVFLAGFIFLCGLIAFFSEGTYDSGDGIQHYLISRYSWKHPELLLHHWGKPFFTLISSPFTQSGLKGAVFFNILCAVFSAFLCYKISKSSGINFPHLALPFLFFAPVYFAVIQSGLTEPFFGFTLIFCIYLCLPVRSQGIEEAVSPAKYILSATIISFLPFVRSEGFLIIPLFIILFLIRRKFWAIPFFALGTVIYSIAGYFYYGDYLWIINMNPYRGAAELYGQGKIYHFLIRAEFIWGAVLFVFFSAGCIWALLSILTDWKNEWGEGLIKRCGPPLTTFARPNQGLSPEEILLIFGSFFMYFIAHTLFWWMGIFGSLGLIRVMAGVMPVSALISLRGLNYILPLFQKNRKRQRLFFIISFLFILVSCLIHNRSIMKLNKEDIVIKKATDWFKNSAYRNQVIYYLHPYVSLALDFDRFDRSTNGELWALNPGQPELGIPSKTVLLWDAHFGPNECEIKLEKLLNNSSFVLLNKFVPEKEFTVLGGNKFEVYLFERK